MPGEDAQRDADDDGDEQARQCEPTDTGMPLPDLLGHGWAAHVVVARVRLAEVELHRVAEPVDVALEHGAVEAELRAHARRSSPASAFAPPAMLGGGVAGDQLDQQEHD